MIHVRNSKIKFSNDNFCAKEEKNIKVYREEIQWVTIENTLFTTLFIWDNRYTPHQSAIFRRDANNSASSIRVYFKIKDYIHSKDFVFKINESTTEQEKLFHIAVQIKGILDSNIDEWSSIINDTLGNEPLEKEVEELLQHVFYDSATMEFFYGTHPDFGFYTLAPNFHKLEKLAKEGISPTINEEFERLMKKYTK